MVKRLRTTAFKSKSCRSILNLRENVPHSEAPIERNLFEDDVNFVCISLQEKEKLWAY